MGELSEGGPGAPEPRDVFEEWLEEWSWHALVVMFYLPVANGAVVYLWWADGPFALRAHTIGFQPAADAALGVAVGLALFAAWAALTPVVPWLRGLAEGLGQALGRPSWIGCLAVAVASAAGEELLFRAVIQERLGLAVGVAAFAAAHVPWERRMAPWPLLAVGSGVVLGLLYGRTGAVVAPVFAHLVLNFLALRWIGRRYGRVSAPASTGSAR
jgi:membrane protease YdiL (CAAX protease family)